MGLMAMSELLALVVNTAISSPFPSLQSTMPSSGPQNAPPPEPTMQDPYLHHTECCWNHLRNAGDITGWMIKVLQYMDTLRINLPILLLAISWNVKDLISDPYVKFASTTLMVSNELLTILSHWFKPPQLHNQGIRTKAANNILTGWTLNLLLEKVNHEMKSVGNIQRILYVKKPCLALPSRRWSLECKMLLQSSGKS